MTLDLLLDPLAGRSGNEPDAGSPAVPMLCKEMEQAVEDFRTLKSFPIASFTKKDYDEYLNKLNEQCDIFARRTVFTPPQIEFLLQMILSSTDRNKIERVHAGLYLSKFIQRSYTAGHNNFRLNLENCSIPSLGSYLAGNYKEPIKLQIVGDAGLDCGQYSTGAEIEVLGDIDKIFGLCGISTSYCKFTLNGHAGLNLARFSNHSEYILNGTIAYIGQCISDCVFKTPKPSLYNELRIQLVDKVGCHNNKIILMDKSDDILDQEVIN